MLINIPLTVMDVDSRRSANLVRRLHLPRMYADGLRQLGDVSEGNVQRDEVPTEQHVSMLRWAGSERYLYNLVAHLGQRLDKFDHTDYSGFLENPLLVGTERTPCWVESPDVFDRHKVELAYVNDLDRIHTRWTQSDNPEIQAIHSRGVRRDPLGFTMTCRGLGYSGEMKDLHLDLSLLTRLLDSYPLYTIGTSEFFRRNLYHSAVRSRTFVAPYIQQTIVPSALSEFLNNRSNRTA